MLSNGLFCSWRQAFSKPCRLIEWICQNVWNVPDRASHHRPSYRLKTSSIKVTILKTKSAIIAFCLFSSSPFSSQLWGERFLFSSCGISRHTVAFIIALLFQPLQSVGMNERPFQLSEAFQTSESSEIKFITIWIVGIIFGISSCHCLVFFRLKQVLTV